MKKLSEERMVQLQGGCTCSGAGICCERVVDWAVCFNCQGEFLYAEPW
jgi:hypothetical protein